MDNLNSISTMVVGSSSIINSSSSLSFPSPNWIHHVFPSFHGPDVRKRFLSHLLKSFKSNGIEPFIDNAIERSKSIGPELKKAIRGSRIAIVLLSKNYASSSWCLDELVEIMRCREVLGQIVITIFYKVQPADIRKQTGEFGEAFKETCKGKTKEHIKRWEEALENVAGIAGMDSSAWDTEAAMIEKIITEVSDKLKNFTPPSDFKDLVGMRAHMVEIERLLCLDQRIGIWGPPGIGKTTIARFLFHQLSSRFQLGAIIFDIKGKYPRPFEYDAKLQLQNRMLSQMINQNVSNIELAFNRLKDEKVLLVLDDVDRIEQVHALAKEIGYFGPGSCIIITTEDRRILEAQGIIHIYKVKSPSSEEVFKIFCMNAFGKEYPDDGFYDLAWKATYLAGSLPLGLKVLGSALRGMSKQEWRRALPMLKARLVDGDIESIIKFSYDALHDDEKDLFLYIACLFTGPPFYRIHEVEELLAKKFWNVKQSLDILVQKSFISIHEYDGVIWAHTLLEQFGRETSRKQVKRQLLFNERDLYDHTIDCSNLIGINLDFSWLKDEELNELKIRQLKYEELSISERMSDVQFVCIFDRYGVSPFKRLQSLLYYSQMIRRLHWFWFPNISLPATFNPEYLVELSMPYSKLQKLWEGNKPLKCLKRMDLSGSHFLKKLPDLSTAINLERLDIRGCSSLRKLRKFHRSNNLVSPQLFDSLLHIEARDCRSLERLDCSFNNPDICLFFTNCFKLNQKARDLIMHTPTSKYAVLPGKHVPTCFNYRATNGGSLTIKLNETSLPTSLRFKACFILLRSLTRHIISPRKTINIMVKNKRLKIEPQTELIYTFEVEVSEVTTSELVFEFKTDDTIWKVGECGLLQILKVPIKGRIVRGYRLLQILEVPVKGRKPSQKLGILGLYESFIDGFDERLGSEDRNENKEKTECK